MDGQDDGEKSTRDAAQRISGQIGAQQRLSSSFLPRPPSIQDGESLQEALRNSQEEEQQAAAAAGQKDELTESGELRAAQQQAAGRHWKSAPGRGGQFGGSQFARAVRSASVRESLVQEDAQRPATEEREPAPPGAMRHQQHAAGAAGAAGAGAATIKTPQQRGPTPVSSPYVMMRGTPSVVLGAGTSAGIRDAATRAAESMTASTTSLLQAAAAPMKLAMHVPVASSLPQGLARGGTRAMDSREMEIAAQSLSTSLSSSLGASNARPALQRSISEPDTSKRRQLRPLQQTLTPNQPIAPSPPARPRVGAPAQVLKRAVSAYSALSGRASGEPPAIRPAPRQFSVVVPKMPTLGESLSVPASSQRAGAGASARKEEEAQTQVAKGAETDDPGAMEVDAEHGDEATAAHEPNESERGGGNGEAMDVEPSKSAQLQRRSTFAGVVRPREDEEAGLPEAKRMRTGDVPTSLSSSTLMRGAREAAPEEDIERPPPRSTTSCPARLRSLCERQVIKNLRGESVTVAQCASVPAISRQNIIERIPRKLRNEHLSLLVRDLTSLSLTGAVYISKTELEKCLACLGSTCPNLRHIALGNMSPHVLTDDCLKLIGEQCAHLQSLDLCGAHSITNGGLKSLAAGTLNVKALISLKLSCCFRLTAEGLCYIAPPPPPPSLGSSYEGRGSEDSTALECLFLDGLAHLEDQELASIVTACPLLQELRLARCRTLTKAAFCVLPTNAPGLAKICFDGCEAVDDDCMSYIASGCGPKLREVSLNRCPNVSSRGVGMLLRACRNIESLGISHSEVTDYCTKFIAHYVPGIREVDLSGCQSISKRALLLLIKKCHMIEVLSLKSTNADDEVLQALADYNRALRRLNLSFCLGVSLQKIEALLNELWWLEDLELWGTGFLSSDLHRLDQKFKGMCITYVGASSVVESGFGNCC